MGTNTHIDSSYLLKQVNDLRKRVDFDTVGIIVTQFAESNSTAAPGGASFCLNNTPGVLLHPYLLRLVHSIRIKTI